MNSYTLAFWCWFAILGTLLIRFSICYVALEFFSYVFPGVYQNTVLKTTIAMLCTRGLKSTLDEFSIVSR